MDFLLEQWTTWLATLFPFVVVGAVLSGAAYYATGGRAFPNRWSDSVVKAGLFLAFLPIVAAWHFAKLIGNWAWHYLNPPTSKKKKKKGKK